MSVGNDLQEMENVVTKNAAPGEPMQKLTTGGTPATWEDLGGPTPENSKPDDNSNKLATPGKTLKQVRDVVNAKATAGDQAIPSGNATPGTLKQGDEPEVKDEQEVVAEDEKATEEVVAEEPTKEEEVVSEVEDMKVYDKNEVSKALDDDSLKGAFGYKQPDGEIKTVTVNEIKKMLGRKSKKKNKFRR